MDSFTKTLGFISSVVLVSLCVQLVGCASGSQASKGAKQGAVQGAAAGAVGGLVSALVFGGDPLDRAARGAVYGGTVGAVSGGIAGSNRDKQIKAQQQAQSQAQAQAAQQRENETLKKEIGKPAFNGLAALAECQHELSLKRAKKAQKAENPNHRLAGLWLEALNYADQQQNEQLGRLLPVIVEKDWDIQSLAQAEQVTRETAAELIAIRKEYGLPLVCS